PAVIGSKCQIEQGAHIKGPVVIGADCHVGERASIKETVLWRGVNIGAGASL
ncbi:unnamed protein product, partial [marine sediment metagenome]